MGRLPEAGPSTRTPGKQQSQTRTRTETLGDRIRNLRRERGLRLVDMAKLTDLSVSFISQVERGLTNPGMRSLILMADALEVRPHSLLEERPQSDSSWLVTRAAEQPEMANDGGTVRSVTSNVNPRFNVFDFTGGPRKFFTWYKVAEDLLIILLAGQLEVEVETEKLLLSAGDTLFVRGGTNHRWRQCGRARCRLLTVLHAPQGKPDSDSMLGAFAGQAGQDGPDEAPARPEPTGEPTARKR